MQGVPGHRSGLPDHHLRMLDMAAYLNQGPNSDTAGLILDQYSNSFNAAAALYSPPFAAVGPASGLRMPDHHHQTGYMNGMMKLEAIEGCAGEQSAVTNVTSASGEVSGYSSSGERETTNTGTDNGSTAQQNGALGLNSNGLTVKVKAKRKLPGMPDPDAEVVALSPKTLLATNRFVCEICNKGFQRDQNLQLHRRGHNLPWKLKQRGTKEVRKKVYVCPETSCVHHDPVRALGDLTGIKKHFSRKHGEKKWKCDKCSKRYAVQSDWKAHSKTCGTREYRCDCGTLFSRRDSFITHRAFCDALAEESAMRVQNQMNGGVHAMNHGEHHLGSTLSTAVAAQLAQGGAAAFGGAPTFGGSAGGLPPKSLLDHLSPFENSLVNAASASAARANRLPLWLSAAAAAGDHHHQLLSANPNSQLLGANPNPQLLAASNPNSLSLNAALLNSYQSNGNSLFFSNSSLQSPSALAQAGGTGVLYGNSMSEFDLLGDANANANFAGLSSLNGLAGFSNSVNNQSLYSSHGHVGAGVGAQPSSPQVSATSLLQKAAQMGSVNTSSNPSLFKHSMASSMAPVSSTDALYWPTSSSMKGSNGVPSMGVNNSFSRGQPTSSMNGFQGDKGSSMINIDSRLRSNFLNNMDSAAAIHEMVASFNNGAAAGGGSPASFFMGGHAGTNNTSLNSSKGSSPMINCNNLNNTTLMPCESPRNVMHSQQALLQHEALPAPIPAALMGLPAGKIKIEDGGAAADNFTRDFLGVRGDNGMLESTLSHRDLGIDSYNHNYSNSKDNLSSEDENMSGQSHAKPWDHNQL